MMRGVLIVAMMLGFLAAVLRAQEGVVAEVTPSQVRPGDLFELRVSMERAEYARFELEVPGYEHLHRVAVEAVPVRLKGGVYRQRESWLLQADSSGEFSIDGASLKLETASGIESLALPPLRIEVLPYSETDESMEPVGLPSEDGASAEDAFLGWVVGGVLLALVCWWWMLKSNRTGVFDPLPEEAEIHGALERLEKGRLDQKDLEQLMAGRDWSEEAKSALAEVVYGGGKDLDGLVRTLRKEVAK